MTLVETLNNIHFLGDGEGITFLADCNGDIDPDDARCEVTNFIIDDFLGLPDREDIGDSDCERAKQLCIYGAALFHAIDQHDADDMDCRDVPR